MIRLMNEQREIIYKERRQVLDGENMRDAIYNMITGYCRQLCGYVHSLMM